MQFGLDAYFSHKVNNASETFLTFNFHGLKPEFIFIPKSEIENQDIIKTELHKLAERLKIDFQNKLDWKW